MTDGWVAAPGSFLFSLRNNDGLAPFKSSLKNGKEKFAIRRRNTYGPTFGSEPDLSILPKNSQSEAYFGKDYQLPSGYTSGNPNAKSLIAGSTKFIPAEVEVLNLM